ncbi:MAG: LuxR C-terminal-related transcriptional regulator [Tannerella sp.]|jgi:DNA-binding CsgD family transcriptional regulator|nr:LuxR C-terminal-related transcriptional regulator [Tannerella sp.]
MNQEEKNRLWEKHRPYVEVLSQVNNSCVAVAELKERFLYISSNFADFFDYAANYNSMTLEERGEVFDSCVHPDDLPFLLHLQERAFDYIFSLPVERRKDYKHIFEFRVLGPGRKYVRAIFQYHILEGAESEGEHILEEYYSSDYILLLFVADLSPDQNPDEPVKFRLYNFKTNEVVQFPLLEEKDMTLTKREVEVLKLVNEGMLSKEISDKLSISIHTVNRHRQNILEKMEVDNLHEAINYGRKLGLIG